VSVFGSEQVRADSLDGLRHAHGFLQRRIAGELRLKRTPTLEFAYDDTSEKAMQLDALIDAEIANAQGEQAGQASQGEDDGAAEATRS
jgi:ribosome-binding factor A